MGGSVIDRTIHTVWYLYFLQIYTVRLYILTGNSVLPIPKTTVYAARSFQPLPIELTRLSHDNERVSSLVSRSLLSFVPDTRRIRKLFLPCEHILTASTIFVNTDCADFPVFTIMPPRFYALYTILSPAEEQTG